MPRLLTPTIGREDDIAAVVGMFDGEGERLVTLLGPRGIGKTRLGLAVATEIMDEFADGACFASLAPVRDARVLPSAVAEALGLQEAGARSARDLVASVLAERHLLLLLDNLEHLVDGAAPWIAELLQRCPRIRILATSRVPLGLSGERRFIVEPLALPDAGQGGESPAIDLFTDRARAVRHDFRLDAGNRQAVIDICRIVDGVPLAIEIAASQVRLMPPNVLRDRLSGGLTRLTSDRHDIPARHRTMRDAISWSHELLSAEQQRLFRRLGVFAGGLTLEAAEAVADSDSALAAISALVDHSLIRSVPGNDSRLEMLEPVREYALGLLETSGEAADVRDRHAAWYVELARSTDATLHPAGQIETLRLLAQEHGNIRAALAWLEQRGAIEDALEMAGSLWFFLWIRGHYTEGRATYERLLAHPLAAARTASRAKALNGLGIIALHQGDTERSVSAHQEAMGIFDEVGEREYHLWAMLSLGTMCAVSDRRDAGIRLLEDGYRMARETGFVHAVQAAACNLGVVAMERGDLAEARRWMRESHDNSVKIGEAWGRSLALMNLSEIDLSEGHVERAERQAREALELVQALGDRRDLPLAQSLLAEVARHRGDVPAERQYLEDALTAARAIGDTYATAWMMTSLAALLHRSGEQDRALALLREAIDAQMRMRAPIPAMQCLDILADIASAAGDADRAARFIGAVDAALERDGVARWETVRGEHRDRIQSLQSRIGEHRYREAWESGHGLSVDRALEEARRYDPPARARSNRVDAAPTIPDTLSPRELEVLRLMADGLTNQEIADRLYVSHRTATSHTSNIIGKLGVATRTAAVAYAIRNGLA